ncbi:hypothetical protein [Streptomyces sp. NPDC101166]|uniref:hypothetical protein n=1 Tax=Streptomyces sp. NPDC101166 TaxID=3366120 RepID=UPI00380B845A
MHRATALLHHVDVLYSWSVGVLNAQTLGFWAHLDRTAPHADFTAFDEEGIGALYVDYQRNRAPEAAPALLAPDAPLHPAGDRILELWTRRLRELGVDDPGLRNRTNPRIGLDDLVALLAELHLCIDQRRWGGPVHLDATGAGMPLRLLVSADGTPNYLASMLRELVPLVRDYDDLVLTCDREARPDFALVRHVLERLGARVHLVVLGRVRGADGHIKSARHGGWEGLTAAALAERYLDLVGPDIYRLGMRLYFIAVLGRGDPQPHRTELLRRCMGRAQRVLKMQAPQPAETTLRDLLARHQRPHPCVDPYRLTTGLLAQHRRGTTNTALLDEVYL